jgi:hypothetical protein
MIEIWDPPPGAPTPRTAAGQDTGGRGLAIVGILAESR